MTVMEKWENLSQSATPTYPIYKIVDAKTIIDISKSLKISVND